MSWTSQDRTRGRWCPYTYRGVRTHMQLLEKLRDILLRTTRHFHCLSMSGKCQCVSSCTCGISLPCPCGSGQCFMCPSFMEGYLKKLQVEGVPPILSTSWWVRLFITAWWQNGTFFKAFLRSLLWRVAFQSFGVLRAQNHIYILPFTVWIHLHSVKAALYSGKNGRS